ncbi:GGDEF domain-containing protein [Saccharopolyspora taberi]|uniref:GGDEF domain-containing protein n=1 Tax=Saccharopolyspora taberi TaxID=60895 RepID=A0ABN3VL89_9PSEU
MSATDDARELVQRAYDADSRQSTFDPHNGLADVLRRAGVVRGAQRAAQHSAQERTATEHVRRGGTAGVVAVGRYSVAGTAVLEEPGTVTAANIADWPRTDLLDPLTQLPGRDLLLDRLEQSLTRSRTRGTLTTLVLLDVHQLSAFNTEHGFERGDELLTTLAGRLCEGMSDSYTVFRYGGDEFAVVAEHPGGTGEEIAEQAREVTSWPMRVGRKRVRPGLRVSWVTTNGRASVDSVLARAEQLLHN